MTPRELALENRANLAEAECDRLRAAMATDRATLLAELESVKAERDEWVARATELENTMDALYAAEAT